MANKRCQISPERRGRRRVFDSPKKSTRTREETPAPSSRAPFDAQGSPEDGSSKTEKLKSPHLAGLRQRQAVLERQVANAKNLVLRRTSQVELQNAKAMVAQLEATSRVPYRDYIASLSEERKQFEEEKAQLRTKLAEAENKRLQAVDALVLQEQKKSADVASYKAALAKATSERKAIANQYAEFTEKYHQQIGKMKQDKVQFLSNKGQLQQTLVGSKKKHSQVLEALSTSPTVGKQLLKIPEQDEINRLREDLATFNSMRDKKKLKTGLVTTRAKLEKILDKLYKAGKFSRVTSCEDIGSALGEMEKGIILQREDQDNHRNGLLEKIKNQDMNNYDDNEIASLKKTNEEMAASDLFQKEIIRRSFYLKAVVEVSDLMKECNYAIRDVNERNLANLWAEAIQGAADSPLAKLWVETIQEAKDSDFAKAWVEAINNTKNSNLAKVWTKAIEDSKNINIAEIWNEAVQNLKDSPLSKLWADTINNAKNSPFAKECANALEVAKNSFCEVIFKFNKTMQ